jgi:hypothetical protein
MEFKLSIMPQRPLSTKDEGRAIERNEVMNRQSAMYHNEQVVGAEAFERTLFPESPYYQGVDPRRRCEDADGGMVREDRQEMANLSRVAIHHQYPTAGYYTNPYIDSVVRGKDETKLRPGYHRLKRK